MKKIKGIIVPLCTPLNQDESVDIESLKHMIDIHQGLGVHGIFVLGTSGENPNLSHREKLKLLEAARQHGDFDLPLMSGVIETGYKNAITSIADFSRAGAQAAVVLLPHYFAIKSDRLVEEFFQRLADESPLPLLIYNEPVFSRKMISEMSVLKLAEHPNIIGIKDSSYQFGFFQKLLYALKGREGFSLITGDPLNLGMAFHLGADAGMIGSSNFDPEGALKLYEAASRNDMPAIHEHQQRVNSYRECVMQCSSPRHAMRIVMSKLGMCAERCTEPYERISENEREKLLDQFSNLLSKYPLSFHQPTPTHEQSQESPSLRTA